jgi:hypothetical protein
MASKRKPRAAKAPAKRLKAPVEHTLELSAPKAEPKTRLWIPLVILAAIVGLGIQIYIFSRKTVDLNKDFIYDGRVCQRGLGRGHVMGSYAMTTDTKGHFFNLDIDGEVVRVQEYALDGKFMGQTELKGEDQIKGPDEIVTDSLGAVYVLEIPSGTVVKLSPSLKFVTRFHFETDKLSGLTINDKDEMVLIDVARGGFLKSDLNGKSLGFVQVKDSDIVSGRRLLAAPGGGYAVLYNLNDSMVVGTYTETGALLDKWKVTAPLPNAADTFGIDNEKRVFFNDGGGNGGVYAYSFSGKFLGDAKSAGPGLDFLNQGCIYVDRITGKIFLNSPVGIDMVEFKWK